MAKRKGSFWRNVGLAVIALPLLFYGANTFDSGGAGGIALKIGDRYLTMEEFNLQLERAFRNLDASSQQQPAVRDLLAAQLVARNMRTFLLLEHANELGLHAVEAELESWVRSYPDFQVDGAFSPELFAATVGNTRSFLRQLRLDLNEDKIVAALFGTATTPPQLYEPMVRYLTQARKVRRIELPLEDIDESAIGDEELQGYFQQYLDDYVTPEQARFEYVLLDPDAYRAKVRIDEAELEASFASRQDRAAAQAERQLSMILLASEAEANEVASLVDGNFAALARERSLDPGSAEVGGDLGLLARDDLDPAIAAEVFAADLGAVVGPFDLGGEWALFEVTGLVEVAASEFAEVKEELMDELIGERAQLLFDDDAFALSDAVAVAGSSLAAAAQEGGLAHATSDWLALDRPVAELAYPFDDPAVIGEILAAGLIASGEASPLLERGDGIHVLARAIEHKPAVQQSFEEAYDQLRSDYIEVTRVRNMLAKLDEAVLRIRNGDPVPELDFSAAEEIELRQTGELPAGVTQAQRRDIFELDIGAEPTPPFITAFVNARDGVMTLYRIDAIVPGELDAGAAELLATLQSPALRQLELLGFLLELEQTHDIEIADELKRPSPLDPS